MWISNHLDIKSNLAQNNTPLRLPVPSWLHNPKIAEVNYIWNSNSTLNKTHPLRIQVYLITVLYHVYIILLILIFLNQGPTIFRFLVPWLHSKDIKFKEHPDPQLSVRMSSILESTWQSTITKDSKIFAITGSPRKDCML